MGRKVEMKMQREFLKSSQFMPPGPLSDFSMNLFLAKHVHHLEGFPSAVSNTFSHKRCPVSCLSCRKYCLIRSAVSGLVGLWYIPFNGNPGSPGMSNLAIAKLYIS